MEQSARRDDRHLPFLNGLSLGDLSVACDEIGYDRDGGDAENDCRIAPLHPSTFCVFRGST